MSEDELSEESLSEDELVVERIVGSEIEDGRLCYVCEPGDELYDRSDLMDGGKVLRLVLKYEREHPPAWDPVCPYCTGEGCEECECEECERPCRFLQGVNYGCELHPVI